MWGRRSPWAPQAIDPPRSIIFVQPRTDGETKTPMNDYLDRFLAAPASFKKSFAMLVVAWACHPLFLYSLFSTIGAVEGVRQGIMKMTIVSLSLCLLLFLIKKWARALVVMGNLFIVINDLFYFAITSPGRWPTLLCVAVVLFACMGTYWLFTKDSRDYFNLVNPKDDAPGGQTPNDKPDPAR